MSGQTRATRQVPDRFPATTQDQFNYLGRLWHDGQIRCVVRFAGQVDAARMARAVRLTLDAEPVLGCRLVERPWRPYWQRLANLDTLSLCPVVTGEDLDGQMWPFLAAPVDTTAGPLVHVRLFRDQTDSLCLKLDHGGGDGAGAMQYLSLLATTYRGLTADSGYRPPSHASGDRHNVCPVMARMPRAALLRYARSTPGGWRRCAPTGGNGRRNSTICWWRPSTGRFLRGSMPGRASPACSRSP